VVLLVEASPAVRLPLAESLSGDGLAVIEATSGLEALHKARTFKPHIVITDLYLPDLDGLSLSRALRAQEFIRDVPLIGLVGRMTALAPLRVAGFSVILRKPCSSRLLLERVRGLLDREPSGGAVCR